MKRLIDYYLTQWRTNLEHKPLLLRGARQVGKTYAARSLAPSFDTFIEINFEQKPRFSAFFETDLDANRIVRDIEITTGKVIAPGKTLLFFDEIQNAPKVISALRYFYEQIPQLHIIAAGSLLEFQLESVGMPVGRVQSFFMQPLSFLEFLVARNETKIALYLQEIDHQSVSSPVHEKILGLYGEYMAVGGLPEATYHWCQHKSFKHIEEIQRTLVETYRQDFEKYGRQGRIAHLSLLFERIPGMQGRKFKHTHVSDTLKKKDIAPAFALLEKAGIVHKITHSAAQGLPLAAQEDHERFKPLFLDIALAQTLLGPGQGTWIVDPIGTCINKGELAECFVGQEMLAYAKPDMKIGLHYWLREARSSNAEIDYVAVINGQIIPIEVKSGAQGHLKSLHLFLNEHPTTPYGIRLYTGLPYIDTPIRSYPLYCTPKLFLDSTRFLSLCQ